MSSGCRSLSACSWIFDRGAAAAGLIVLAPVYAAIAAAIAMESGLPVLFGQIRIGRKGIAFRILKFRTMRPNAAGRRITAAGDARVTRVGGLLRRFKLDELPQLWNVVKGDMDLVGPRPEVPDFVDMRDPLWKAVLEVRPGITDVATLLHRNEEALLAGAPDPERYYTETILPTKLQLNIDYLRKRSFLLDLKLILLTVWYSVLPGIGNPAAATQSFCGRISHE
jgi:lipopolysaccharide/colanic/teichoic acid biosynthesis glycosyltransferase